MFPHILVPCSLSPTAVEGVDAKFGCGHVGEGFSGRWTHRSRTRGRSNSWIHRSGGPQDQMGVGALEGDG